MKSIADALTIRRRVFGAFEMGRGRGTRPRRPVRPGRSAGCAALFTGQAGQLGVVLPAGDAADRVTEQVAAHVHGCLPRGVVHDSRHIPGVVRGAEQVGQLEERIIGAERRPAARLVPPRVDARREARVVPQVLVQGLLVHDRATGHVDQDRAGLHQAQLAGADQAARARGQRDADDQHVRGGQHPVQIVQRAAELDRVAGMAAAVDRVDPRPERPHQPGHGPADPAVAEDRAHRAVQGGVGGGAVPLAPVPLAAGQGCVLLWEALGQAEHHGHDVLGDGMRIRAHVPGHHDVRGDHVEVHRVQAGRQHLDEPQPRGTLQRPGGHLAAEPQPDQHLGPAQRVRLLRLRHPVEIAEGGQVAENVRVGRGEFAVYRVAHGYQPLVGHRASFLTSCQWGSDA